MDVLTCDLAGVVLLAPKIFGDDRGYFFESWNLERYAEVGIKVNFVQDNESKSKYGVLRGLHYQAPPYTQAKLVRVIAGAVLDVVVDIRKDSPTFGRHASFVLSGENKHQLFVPRGFAHGFAVLSDEAIFSYKCDNSYMPSFERGIAYDDPALSIAWQLDLEQTTLSEKDRKNPLLSQSELFSTHEFMM